MTGPRGQALPGGRLHLWHGPVDLVIGAEGPGRATALAAAEARFATILEELVAELPLLRSPVSGRPPRGATARRMHAAVRAHRGVFVTPMAAVAGAVADEVLAAMTGAGRLDRAYVNNGGDIAFNLAPGQSYTVAMRALDTADKGRVTVGAGDGIGGIASSGQGGRSHSLGIADQVTVLAATAAAADTAATLIANAVDLPGHPAIRRDPASDLAPDSDLGDRPVVTDVGPLAPVEIDTALRAGVDTAEAMRARGLIRAAALMLRGRTHVTGAPTHAGSIEVEAHA